MHLPTDNPVIMGIVGFAAAWWLSSRRLRFDWMGFRFRVRPEHAIIAVLILHIMGMNP